MGVGPGKLLELLTSRKKLARSIGIRIKMLRDAATATLRSGVIAQRPQHRLLFNGSTPGATPPRALNTGQMLCSLGTAPSAITVGKRRLTADDAAHHSTGAGAKPILVAVVPRTFPCIT